MKQFNETEIKYLAGLLDADGSLSFTNVFGYVGLVLNLELAESCDRDGVFIRSLGDKAGKVYTRKREENWAQTNTWRITRRSDIEQLIPRLVKHMVIKAKHWDTLFAEFQKLKGSVLTEEAFDILRESQIESRKNVGPLKNKIHPTWAWVTGYLEGDGWILIRKRQYQTEMQIGAVSHVDDRIGIDLLQKAFGGVVKIDSKGYVRWIRNLGPRDASFVKRFMPKLISHSQLKRHKMEEVVSIHSQRLNEIGSTEHVIV